MKKSHPPVHQIELRIVEPPELIDTMDPTSLHHHDLGTDSEEFLESWALEFPQDSPLRIVASLNWALHFAQEGPQQARVVTLLHRRDALRAPGPP